MDLYIITLVNAVVLQSVFSYFNDCQSTQLFREHFDYDPCHHLTWMTTNLSCTLVFRGIKGLCCDYSSTISPTLVTQLNRFCSPVLCYTSPLLYNATSFGSSHLNFVCVEPSIAMECFRPIDLVNSASILTVISSKTSGDSPCSSKVDRTSALRRSKQ